MTVWQMSVSGGLFILAVMAVRAVLLNRLPKRTLLFLWGLAALRLCVPFAIPSRYSVWSLLPGNGAGEAGAMAAGNANGTKERPIGGMGETATGQEQPGMPVPGGSSPVFSENKESAPSGRKEAVLPEPEREAFSVPASRIWLCVWALGSGLCLLYFTAVYLRESRKFRSSRPVETEWIREWQKNHPLRRPLEIRQSDRIAVPLTYGILRPVILLPKAMGREDRETLRLVLEHEFVHVRRLDSASKIALTGILCVHWFNPLVWAMALLCNRDMELACDEAVLKRLGAQSRRAYALALICMEELAGGLSPLASRFGGSAMEERITAIMKNKKGSAAAVLLAVLLAAAGFAALGTTGEPIKAQAQDVKEEWEDGFLKEEWERLLALQFPGYLDMTVKAYQEQVWRQTDTQEYRELLERFSGSEELYEKRDEDERAAFLFYILEPLTAERWQTREFDGAVARMQGDTVRQAHGDDGIDGSYDGREAFADQALLEYSLRLTITDASSLTVREYQEARQGAQQQLRAFFGNRSEAELADTAAESTRERIRKECEKIAEGFCTPALQMEISFGYFSFSGFDGDEARLWEEARAQQRESWEQVLAPYEPFGLTWEYEQEEDGSLGIRMYWEGFCVRGIYDEQKALWITEHTGNGAYGPGAVELTAVYEAGRLSGLQAADEKEQAEWDALREQNSLRREERLYPHGTEEDYRSLFAEMMTEGYRELSLSEFNARLLDWCNAHSEAMERIGMDAFLEDYEVSLTEEEKEFAALTMALSREENARMVTALNTGAPQEDVRVDGSRGWLSKEEEDGGRWRQMSYCFTYRCEDPGQVTVGERDRAVAGFMQKVEEFWSLAGLQKLLQLEEEDVVTILAGYANECGSEGVRITVEEAMVQFEHNP